MLWVLPIITKGTKDTKVPQEDAHRQDHATYCYPKIPEKEFMMKFREEMLEEEDEDKEQDEEQDEDDDTSWYKGK